MMLGSAGVSSGLQLCIAEVFCIDSTGVCDLCESSLLSREVCRSPYRTCGQCFACVDNGSRRAECCRCFQATYGRLPENCWPATNEEVKEMPRESNSGDANETNEVTTAFLANSNH